MDDKFLKFQLKLFQHYKKKTHKDKILGITKYQSELPWWLRWQSICLQYGRPGFNPWVGKISWRRKWQPTPVFLPGESQGRKSLAGYSPWGRKVRHD